MWKFINKFVRYIAETYRNKLIALFMIAIGLLVLVLDRDVTILVFTTIFGIPLFLSKKDWSYRPED